MKGTSQSKGLYMLGQMVTIETANQEEVTGRVYVYDEIYKLLILSKALAS